ncbi:MAG: tetratricopeptide repeat protein, partial [Myxococcota bacterium]
TELTARGVIVGTLSYISPEQARDSSELDHRTDVYALGVLIFQLLCGRLPFSAETPISLLSMHLHDPVPDIRDFGRHLPAAVAAAMRRAMAKSPTDRHSSATELVGEVSGALGFGGDGLRPRALHMDAIPHGPRVLPHKSAQGNTPNDQNKIVTILCTNADEYGALIEESSGTAAARRALLQFRSTAEDILRDHGATLLPGGRGGGLTAVWGASETREDDAERAVRAGLTIRAYIEEWSADLVAAPPPGRHDLGADVSHDDLRDDSDDDDWLPVNIGVHTGLILLSEISDDGGFSASGVTITSTERLMRQAEGTILISHPTYVQVRGVFMILPHAPLVMRRSHKTIPTYRVLTAKPLVLAVPTRGVEGVETPMIGREAELKRLQDAYLDAIEERETQLVTVVGATGVGKSRLLDGFRDWTELRPEMCWVLRATATPGMDSQPYSLLRALLSFRFEIHHSDHKDEVRHKLERGIRTLLAADDNASDTTVVLGSRGDNETETAHLLGHLAGFDLADSPFVRGLYGDAEQLRMRAGYLFGRWLADVCAKNPVAFELEDTHHADAASLDLVANLVTEHSDLPMVVICLARPRLFEHRPSWGQAVPCHARIELAPLDKRSTRRLIREILYKAGQVPRQLRDMLVERCEGNPYYLEELIKMLIDDRVIIKDNQRSWRVEESRLGRLNVPTTLASLLQNRLDRLLYPERLTLQRAAVLGPVFHDRALAAIDRTDDVHVAELSGVLASLSRRQFILRRDSSSVAGCTEYVFASLLVRDMLLSTLLRRQREHWSAAAAEWLIAVSGDRLDELSERIASFYQACGDVVAAAEYWHRAGRRALRTCAFGSARTELERALNLLPDEYPGPTGDGSGPDRLAMELDLGEVYCTLGEYRQARITLERALQLARSHGDTARTISALLRLGRVSRLQGDYQRASDALDTALPIARGQLEPVLLARVLHQLGYLQFRRAIHDRARHNLDESLALARGLGDSHLEAEVLSSLGIYFIDRGDSERAQTYLDEALDLARRTGDRRLTARVFNQLGIVAERRNELSHASAYIEQSLTLSRELGDPDGICLGAMNLAEMAILGDALDSARRYLHQATVTALRIGSAVRYKDCVHLAGWLLVRVGQRERGFQLLGLALHHPPFDADTERNVLEKLDNLGTNRATPEIAA